MTTIVSKADLDDQRWLDQQVATLGDGIEAARDIWANWTDLRNVGRLHPGMEPGDYLASLGLRLTVGEALSAFPDMSYVQLAKVAGVTDKTVAKAATSEYSEVERPARTLGGDGKYRPGRVVREVTAEVIQPEEEQFRPLTPAEVRGPSFERTFRHALRNFRTEYGEFASKRKYAALFAAIDKALEN